MSDDEANIKNHDEDNIEEALPDWSLINGKSKNLKHDEQLPKRSEKYFDHDGSHTQVSDLTRARNQMYDALLCVRGHLLRQNLVAVWIPERKMALIPHAKGGFFKDIGIAHSFRKKKKIQGMWLNPIETVYLTERGSLSTYLSSSEFLRYVENEETDFDYNSLQQLLMSHLYALAFGGDPDLVNKYQVYALLKRLGYIILDFTQYTSQLDQWQEIQKKQPQATLLSRVQSWLCLLGFFSRSLHKSFHYRHTHYFNYTQVFTSLRLIPSYTAFETLNAPAPPDPQYLLQFNVWKPTPSFSKKLPPLPDFQVAIADIAKASFPSLGAIQSMWNQLNFSFDRPMKQEPKEVPGKKKKAMPPTKRELKLEKRKAREQKLDPRLVERNNYLKLRDSKLRSGTTGRSVVLATIDNGIITFNSLNETEFSLTSPYCTADLNAITEKYLHGIVWNEPIKL